MRFWTIKILSEQASLSQQKYNHHKFRSGSKQAVPLCFTLFEQNALILPTDVISL